LITRDDFFMGRDKSYPDDLTQEIEECAKTTIDRANLLLTRFRQETGDTYARKVNSGWRPPAINASTPGAARKSKHMLGQAIDIDDDNGALDEWCLNNLDALEEVGLWLESPNATDGWCHLQIVPPRSGNRVFIP
jgi:hypothetical protein